MLSLSALLLQSRGVTHFSVFDVEELATESSEDQSDRVFHVLRCPDWVCVVPFTPDDRVVLVRQFRVGVREFSLEPPAGVVERHHTPAQAAARELLEETGYAGTLESLGWVHANPALLTNRVHLFAARDAVRVADPTFDGTGEHCEVCLLGRAQVLEAMRRGDITHVIGLAALSAALQSPVSLCSAREAEVAGAARMDLQKILDLLSQMEDLQASKVVALARRLRPDLTPEDIRNPHDFPELNDVDWHYADGHLSGIQSVVMALRAMQNRLQPTAPGPGTEA
jgi:ADP-ribose pyrophosphatase